jgi:hypothetical protein
MDDEGPTKMANELITRRRIGTGLVVVSLLAAAPAMAAEVRVGAVGGVNVADMSGVSNWFYHTCWGAGGVVEVDVTQNLALASRPMYVGKGSEGDLALMPGDVSIGMDLRYVEIPLLVKVSAATGRVRPYLIAGPSLGLLQKAEALRTEVLDVDGYPTWRDERKDIKQDTESTEWSLNAGVGVGLNVRKVYAFVEGIWAWGLTDVSKTEGSIKNRGVQFRAGITLRLGGR